MSATLIERQENAVTIQIHIPLSRSMLDTEEAIQQALNQAGVLATAEALKQFDTDGSPLVIGSTRWTSKGQEPKTYQTPYGEAVVERHVYQTGEGGTTFCPLEREARIILTSTDPALVRRRLCGIFLQRSTGQQASADWRRS